MRSDFDRGLRALRSGVLALGLVALAATGASAQLVFDGNVVWLGNGSGTFSGQFVGAAGAGAPSCAAGTTAASICTGTYTHNTFSDPLLPNAPYKTNTVPNFQPALGSPAYGSAMTLPNDGFFKQVCYKGAIGPNPGDDWTKGWTYWDSTGANRTDLHLVGMPDPRPLATYSNVNEFGSLYFGPDSNYLVRGQLHIKSGGTLTIAPGVVVFEENATLGTIIGERGSKIFAIGNACDPIIITTDDAPGTMTRGHCGGIYMLGRARTNNSNSCAGDSSAAEGGSIGFYGGNDDNDGSGVLRYVRVEYAGKEVTPNNELNSFTFCGVGRNTHADYCEAFYGADDCFEWFGGTMDATHLIGIDGTDDGYDWQWGTRNRAQFVIIRTSPYYAPARDQTGDKGIEADNTEPPANFFDATCSGRSLCQLANCTFVGDRRFDSGGSDLYPGCTSGINWRRGTGGTFLNSIIYNYKVAAVKIDDDATFENHCANPPALPSVYCPGAALGVLPVATGNLFVARSAPNPFRGSVNFSFTLPQAGAVSVEIYAADGRHVETLAKGDMAAGTHSVVWSLAKDVPSGVYFYKVMSGSNQSTGKITRVD